MSVTKEQIKNSVINYITEHFFFNSTNFSLNENSSFLESGIIDSTGILELINFLQDEYKIKIEDSEMLPENLDSLNGISVFVQSKLLAS